MTRRTVLGGRADLVRYSGVASGPDVTAGPRTGPRQHGRPYRARDLFLVYGTGEVRDFLMVARAVEDPTDSLAVVAALRSAAFGCGDDDLYRWRHSWNGLLGPPSPPALSPPQRTTLSHRAFRGWPPYTASECGCPPARSWKGSCGKDG